MKTTIEKRKDLIGEIRLGLDEHGIYHKFVVGSSEMAFVMRAIALWNLDFYNGDFDKSPYNITIKPRFCKETINGKELSGVMCQFCILCRGSK